MTIKSWANWGFRWKLSLPIGLIAAVIVAIGVANYFLLSKIQAHVEQVMEADMPGTQLLLEMDRDLYQVLMAERSLLAMEPGHPERRMYLKEHRETLDQVETRGAKAHRLFGESEANILLTRFFLDFRQWRQMTESFVAESELAELDAGTDQAYFDQIGRASCRERV